MKASVACLVALLSLGNAETLDGLDAGVVYGHANGAQISVSEDAQLDMIFTKMDTNLNGKVSYDEYSNFIVPAVVDIDAAFNLMDLNEDGNLAYNELVYDEKVLIELDPDVVFDETKNPTIGELDDVFEEVAPGKEYNDETQAEMIAETLLATLDGDKNNYITKVQFTDFFKVQQWAQIAGDDVTIEIDLGTFKAKFFDTTLYQTMRNLHNAPSTDFDKIKEYETKLEQAHGSADEILAAQDAELVFQPHELDEELLAVEASGTRRRLPVPLFLSPLLVFAVEAGTSAALLGGIGAAEAHRRGACYDEYNIVYELNKGPIYIKDASVGDYVFDGDDFSKIYFIQKYDENYNKNMIEILYGNPSDENSITLTPHHLLYYADGNEPVMSGDIRIGDQLYGDSNTNNYTVYDIKNVYNKHPINPITASGNLMVNNIKTSVFTRSAAEHKRLTESGKIFAWISDNINEKLAEKLVDFNYNIIYSRIIRQNYFIYQMFIQYQTFATMVILAVPALIAMFAIKTSKKL